MKLLKKSFFRICAFLGILFASSIPVAAQGDEIYEVPGLNSKKSIVRYWKGMEYIVYTEDGSTSSFSLVDYSSMSCATFSSASYLGVNDFEIAEDSVFFCGFDGTNPIFGYFDIANLFSTSNGLFFTSIGGWISTSSMTQERITELTKLVVQPFLPGFHVYMIGKAEYQISGNPVVHNRCIVDMYYDGTQWKYQFSQEQGSVYYYDDIVLTAGFLEVVGHKNGSSGYYNTQYNHPPNNATPIFNFPPVYATYYYAGGIQCYFNDPYRPVLATHLRGNYYVMVSYANVCLSGIYVNDRGTVISIFDGTPNCVHRYFISQGYADSAKWEFKDIRYNKYTKKLYLLQEMSHPVSGSLSSVICEFDIGTGGAITSSKAYYEPGIAYLSLDQCNNFIEAVAVGGVVPIRLWHHLMGGHCIEMAELHLDNMPLTNYSNGYYQYPINSKCAPSPVSGRLDHYEIIKICE